MKGKSLFSPGRYKVAKKQSAFTKMLKMAWAFLLKSTAETRIMNTI